VHTANHQNIGLGFSSSSRCFPKSRLEKDVSGKCIVILGDVLIKVTSASEFEGQIGSEILVHDTVIHKKLDD